MRKIITTQLALLVGLKIEGVEMQVVQPAYLKENVALPMWRKMKKVFISDNLITWEWHPHLGAVTDNGWSSAPTASNPKIQMYAEDYNKYVKNPSRKLWKVWKEENYYGAGRDGYRVQFPGGIMTYHTKKQADNVAIKSEANMSAQGHA